MLLKKSLFRMMGIAVAACSLAGAAVGLTVTAVSEHNANVVVAASGDYTFTIQEPKGVRYATDSTCTPATYFSFYAGLTNARGQELSVESSSKQPIDTPFSSIIQSSSEDGLTTYTVTIQESTVQKYYFNFYYKIEDAGSIETISLTSSLDQINLLVTNSSNGTGTISVSFDEWQSGLEITSSTHAAQETVTLPTAVGYYFTTEQGGSQHVPTVSVEKGGNTDVYLHARDGYTLENATVTRSDGIVVQGEAVDGGTTCKKYTLTNVNSDISLIVEGVVLAPYTVTVENEHDGNFTFNGDKTVTAGSSYSFQVTANAGYTVTKVSYQIGDGAKNVLASSTGTYFIPASQVTGNITIKVETEAAKYLVSLPHEENYYFTKTAGETEDNAITSVEVTHGDSNGTKVYLHAKDGYTVENAQLRLSQMGATQSTLVSGQTVAGKDNTAVKEFTLTNITANGSVSVTGVAKKIYTVSNLSGDGYTINGISTVEHGANYTFTVSVTEAGKEINSVKYSMGKKQNEELTAASGVYTITNVTGNVTITVELKDTEYTLTFPLDPQGYKITEENGDTELKGNKTVNYGNYKIKVELLPGWTGEIVVHYTGVAGAQEPTSDGNGVWTIKVVGSGRIEITGISQATYTITGEADAGYTYIPTSSPTVNYNGTFSFSVTANPGYKTNGYNINVTSSTEGNILKAVESGTNENSSTRSYTITGIQGNVTIEIKMKDDAAITYTITDSSTNKMGYTLQVKIGDADAFSNLSEQTIPYGAKLEIKVEKADGYTLGGVSITPTAHELNGVYAIESVTQNVRITVSVTENTLTVIYKESNGSQIGSPVVKKYSELEEPLTVLSAATQMAYKFFDAAWLYNSNPFTEAEFTQETITEASATYELYRTYQIKQSVVSGLFEADQWYAKATADDDGQHYTIEVRMAVITEQWKLFLDELETVGGKLVAVGFSYSNFKNETDSAKFYTEDYIKGCYDKMTSATGKDSGKIEDAIRKDEDTNRELWLFGYRWTENNDAIQNQKQTITGLKANAKRYVSHWFMVSIGNNQYVFQSERTKVEGLDAAPAPQQRMLPMTHVLSIEDDEMPTIE